MMNNSNPSILTQKKQAYSFLQNNQLSEAKALLAQICKIDRRDADVWNMRAAVHGMLGEYAEAERSARKVAELQPTSDGAYNNLANALKAQGKLVQAETAYRRALQLQPNNADAYNNLAGLLRTQGKIEEAQACYVRALQLKPDHIEACFSLGILLQQQRKTEEAQVLFERVIQMKPDHVKALLCLGDFFQKKGAVEDAERLFNRALQINPESEETRYLLATLGVGEMPTQAPSEHLKQLFDGYAENFDEHLTGGLHYRTPELLCELLSPILHKKEAGLDVLDLGCGTGLCGPLFREVARHLVGVDLSPGMLDKARKRNIYDDLVLGDVTLALSASPAAYDLILAADVFVYIGDLQCVFELVYLALRPGGMFAFSTESTDQVDQYELRVSGRYAHAAKYISSLAKGVALDEVSVKTVELRHEFGKPVIGNIFILRKPETISLHFNSSMSLS